ncbi:MAG: exo-alpha-sialidase [Anaerolineae bacterium]
MNTDKGLVTYGLAGIWVILLLGLMFLMTTAPAVAQGGTVVWEDPVRLSDPDFMAWPTSIVADSAGNVHIMWSQTLTENPPPGEGDTIFYTRWDGEKLLEPVDVLVSREGASIAPQVAVTADGLLHAVWYTGGENSRLLYASAPACCADNPRNWSRVRSLGGPVFDAPGFMADASGRLHAAFAANDSSNIVYVRSDDGGETWPVLAEIPGNALLSDEYAASPRLAVDGKGRVHMVWEIGPFPGRTVMYARSDDGGNTWNVPEEIDTWQRKDYASGFGPLLIDVEAVGDDQVHIIWDGAPTIERTHIWSADGGVTWSPYNNQVFPSVTGVGRSGFNDMAVDSAGRLHAISIHGNRNALHSAWNNGFWLPPIDIPTNGAAEHPHIAISEGNIIHFVWTDKNQEPFINWYVKGKIEGAPKLPAVPLSVIPPTVTPAPTIVPSTPTPAPAPTPELTSAGTQPLDDAPSTSLASNNPGMAIVVGLVPVLLFIGVIVLVRLIAQAR